MKKLLTRVLTLALVLCCFTFVGCTKDEEPAPKPATIEQTLTILDNFVADMKAVETKISAQDYVYPTIDAIRASQAVAGTDKSSIGIEYSNYEDFDIDYNIGQDPQHPYTVKDNYLEMMEMIYVVDMYIDLYSENDLELNVSYRVNLNEYGETGYAYTRLINNNNQINLSLCHSSLDGSRKVFFDFAININNSTWVSWEFKQCYNDDEFFACAYIEKSTHEARLFDRYYLSIVDAESGTPIYDFEEVDEKVQKIIVVDDFSIDSMNALQSKIYNHHVSLNIDSTRDNVDIENATETELSVVIDSEE